MLNAFHLSPLGVFSLTDIASHKQITGSKPGHLLPFLLADLVSRSWNRRTALI